MFMKITSFHITKFIFQIKNYKMNTGNIFKDHFDNKFTVAVSLIYH